MGVGAYSSRTTCLIMAVCDSLLVSGPICAAVLGRRTNGQNTRTGGHGSLSGLEVSCGPCPNDAGKTARKGVPQ